MILQLSALVSWLSIFLLFAISSSAKAESIDPEAISAALLSNSSIAGFLESGLSPNAKINPKDRDTWGANVRIEALLFAAYYGQAGNVKELLKRNADITVKTPGKKNNALLLAVMGVNEDTEKEARDINGYPQVVMSLLEAGLSPDHRNTEGHDAAYYVKISNENRSHFSSKIISGLLDVYGGRNTLGVSKADLKLFVAVSNRDPLGIAEALKNGANVNASLHGSFPVELAAALSDEKSMVALLKGGNVAINQALSYAYTSKSDAMAKLLTSTATTAKPNESSISQYSQELLNISMLSNLLGNGLVQAKFYLANGADPNIKDRNYWGITSLSYAVLNGNKELIKLLLSYNADPNSQVPYITMASWQGDSISKIPRESRLGTFSNAYTPALISFKGMQYSKSDIRYFPLLAYAVHKDNVELATLLLNKGASPSATDDVFGSLLNSAIADGYIDMALLLLSKSKNVSSVTTRSIGLHGKLDTMQLATTVGGPSGNVLIKALLDRGVDANSKDVNGNPLIFHVVSQKSMELLKHLITKKTRINVHDRNGKLLIVHASDINPESVSYLLSKGAKAPDVYEKAISAARSWQFDDYYYWINKARLFHCYNVGKEREAEAVLNSAQRSYLVYREEQERKARVEAERYAAMNATTPKLASESVTGKTSTSLRGSTLPAKGKGVKALRAEGVTSWNSTKYRLECNNGRNYYIYRSSSKDNAGNLKWMTDGNYYMPAAGYMSTDEYAKATCATYD